MYVEQLAEVERLRFYTAGSVIGRSQLHIFLTSVTLMW
jgi:ATP adenylyltransferase/5',5'''-P-1,P-4-tetraphosphate phosphorylase II